MYIVHIYGIEDASWEFSNFDAIAFEHTRISIYIQENKRNPYMY